MATTAIFKGRQHSLLCNCKPYTSHRQTVCLSVHPSITRCLLVKMMQGFSRNETSNDSGVVHHAHMLWSHAEFYSVFVTNLLDVDFRGDRHKSRSSR